MAVPAALVVWVRRVSRVWQGLRLVVRGVSVLVAVRAVRVVWAVKAGLVPAMVVPGVSVVRAAVVVSVVPVP